MMRSTLQNKETQVVERTCDQDLKNLGLKSTIPRQKILEVIRNSKQRHLSAEDVYRRLLEQNVMIALATVYRVLSQLEAAGILARNVFESGKAIYEISEGGHHDHLICLDCGMVIEFADDVIESRQLQVAQTHGFQLLRHRLALYGTCPACCKIHHT